VKACVNCRFVDKSMHEEPCSLCKGRSHWVKREEKSMDVKVQSTEARIVKLMTSMRDLLCVKNQRYGDSALSPVHIFCKNDTGSIESRLDDKLARIANSDELRKNDLADLIGYSVLLMLKHGWDSVDDLVD